MVLRNRLFPYPILSKYTDDYQNSEFDVEIKTKQSRDKIEFFFNMKLSDDVLNRLITNGYADYVIHFECSSTCFRDFIRISDISNSYLIDSNKVNNTVVISSYIVAKKEIRNLKNDNFNSIYEGICFDIEKYNVLAIGPQINLDIEKDYDALKNIRSIFAIVPVDENIEYISCDYSGPLISIFLPRKQFSIYKTYGGFEYNVPIIHSVLIVPILTNLFETLKHKEWDELEDRKWFKSLKKAFRKQEMELSEATIENMDSLRFAQVLIDSPILKVFDNMGILQNNEDDDL